MTIGSDRLARTGRIALSMADWSGKRTGSKVFETWADALKFAGSEEFKLMADARRVVIQQLGPPSRSVPGGPPRSHWKPDEEQRAELEDRAQRELTCRGCGASPGEPCDSVERVVCGPRFTDAKKAAIAEAVHQDRIRNPVFRSPEEDTRP